jgi:hypothetical protein
VKFLLKIIFVVGFIECVSLSVPGNARPLGENPSDTPPLPKNLIAELRIFESRSPNPDRDKLSELDFLVKTDGRRITANQWLATMTKQVPGSSVFALAYEISPVGDDGRSAFRWTNGRRSLDVDIRIVSRSSSNRFQAEIRSVLSRDEEPLSKTQREVGLQLNRTTIWSTEVELSNYLSHFREHRNIEARGLLFEYLRSRSVHLLVAISLRVLRDDEVPQLEPIPLSISEPPEIDNPFDFPAIGTIVVGFELSPDGIPLNPEITWSTLPEINPVILGAARKWSFPSSTSDGNARKWGRVELKVDLLNP